MSTRQRASERIIETVTAWPGVAAGPGRRGEFAFTVGRREIGHLHGDDAAHFAFPKDIWADLKEKGRIEDHPIFPGKAGLGARRIETERDIRHRSDPAPQRARCSPWATARAIMSCTVCQRSMICR